MSIDQEIQAAASKYAEGQVMVGEWIVVYESQHMTDDGKVEYRVGIEMSNNSVPIHRIMGLLETAKIHYSKDL